MPPQSTSKTKAGSPVYLAGPMFSTADLWQIDQVASILKKAGYTTYNPHVDGIEVATVMNRVNKALTLPPAQVLEVVSFVHKLVFALDVYQIVERCQAVVLGLDGRVPDDGCVSESAIAFGADKPIVIFKTTPIAMLAGWDNPMVQGLATQWSYVNDAAKIPAAVAKAVAVTAKLTGSPHLAGARLQAVIELGQTIWGQIDVLHRASSATPKVIYSTVTKLEVQLNPLLGRVFL